AGRMIAGYDGIYKRSLTNFARIIFLIAFETPPSIIESAYAIAQLQTYFFHVSLTYISYPHIPRFFIKTKPPWISKSIRPDLSHDIRGIHERIVLRNSIRIFAVYVYPKHFPQQSTQILCPVFGITSGSTIPHTDVQITIRTKYDTTPIVVSIWLFYRKKHHSRGGIDRCGVRVKYVPYDGRIILFIRMIEIEVRTVRIGGMESHTQQTFFIFRTADMSGNIQHLIQVVSISIHRFDLSCFLDYNKSIIPPGNHGGRLTVGFSPGGKL